MKKTLLTTLSTIVLTAVLSACSSQDPLEQIVVIESSASGDSVALGRTLTENIANRLGPNFDRLTIVLACGKTAGTVFSGTRPDELSSLTGVVDKYLKVNCEQPMSPISSSFVKAAELVRASSLKRVGVLIITDFAGFEGNDPDWNTPLLTNAGQQMASDARVQLFVAGVKKEFMPELEKRLKSNSEAGRLNKATPEGALTTLSDYLGKLGI